MDEIKKILFYSDSDVFGGHEIMSIKIANLLSKNNKYKIEFIYSNEKVQKLLNDNIKTYFNIYKDSTPLPFLNNLRIKKIYKIKNSIISINPDIVVICQGNIELGLKGLIASNLARKVTVSYIPFGNYFNEFGAKFAILRDYINKGYYSMPDYFITPNYYQKQLIQNQSKNKNIYTILNPIDHQINKDNKFEKNKIISLGMVGRIDLRHKNQLFSLELAKKLLSENINFKFHIVGDGKDLSKFKKEVFKSKLIEYFIFYGWLDKEQKDKVLSEHVDILLIPSIFETGIPLVVYDALENNKNFLISKLDSIKEYEIPNNYIMNISNLNSVIKKIIYLSEVKDNSEYLKFKEYIGNNFSYTKFEDQVNNTFKSILCGQ